MTKVTPVFAKSEDYRNLAKRLIAKDIEREDVLVWLKGKNYTINNIRYKGIEVVTLMQFWEDINTAIKAGTIKASKAKGLYLHK